VVGLCVIIYSGLITNDALIVSEDCFFIIVATTKHIISGLKQLYVVLVKQLEAIET
jgi:hypothetical protein